VVFGAQNAHRRKSSLVPAEAPAHIFQRRKNTDCYVHSLLESQRVHGRSHIGELDDIAETLKSSTIGSGSGANSSDNTAVEVKGGNRVEHGQEDETSWRQKFDAQNSGHWTEQSSPFTEGQEEEHGAVHSRLLTKKQLSDMAWGVRELSKRLGSIKLKLRVRTVFILTKAHDESLIANTREVTKWLLSPDRDVRYSVWVEENLRENKKFNSRGLLAELEKEYSETSNDSEGGPKLDKRLRYWSNEMCRSRPHNFDFVVTLGGDGTVLYASWLFQQIVPPVLSFGLGSLGFLTKFDYDDFAETLTRSFRDGVTISLRLRFEGTVMRSQRRKKRILPEAEVNGEEAEDDAEPSRDLIEELVGEEKDDEHTHRPDGTYEILNDIVVDRGPNPSESLIKKQMTSVLILTLQLCPRLRFLATMSILPLYRQMASV
jgi:NAD+ kinase